PPFEEVRGERVAERVGTHPLRDPRRPRRRSNALLERALARVVPQEPPAPGVGGEALRREDVAPPPLRSCPRVLPREGAGEADGGRAFVELLLVPRPLGTEVTPQGRVEGLGQHRDAVPAPLAVADGEPGVVEVE